MTHAENVNMAYERLHILCYKLTSGIETKHQYFVVGRLTTAAKILV